MKILRVIFLILIFFSPSFADGVAVIAFTDDTVFNYFATGFYTKYLYLMAYFVILGFFTR